ncbi:MAG: hypothetical protein KUG77_26745, partial [Nannocystaceae bacterium]|nr:hypothetical protein [Nannocystaceae bacterium]
SVQLCLEVFLASKPEYAESIRSGLAARDPHALQIVGHTLAGSFVGILRPHLLKHARALEDEATERTRSGGPLDDTLTLAHRLLSVLDGIEQEVRAHLEAGGAIAAAAEARQVT